MSNYRAHSSDSSTSCSTFRRPFRHALARRLSRPVASTAYQNANAMRRAVECGVVIHQGM